MENVLKRDYTKIFKIMTDTFHKYGLWILVAGTIGLYSGVKASQMYYSTKMNECVAIGGMVVDKQVYTITKK